MLVSFSKMFDWFGANSNNVRTNQQNATARKFQARRRFAGNELRSKNLRHSSAKGKEDGHALTNDFSILKAPTYRSSFLSNSASAFRNTCAFFLASITSATGSAIKQIGDVIYFTTQDGTNSYAVQSTSSRPEDMVDKNRNHPVPASEIRLDIHHVPAPPRVMMINLSYWKHHHKISADIISEY